MKTFALFNTDFYQLSMMLGYILSDIATERTGFEAFTRKLNPKVTDRNAYRFAGQGDLIQYIKQIQTELQDPELLDTFLKIVIPKVPEHQDVIALKVVEKWPQLMANTKFTINMLDTGEPVHPLVPAVQYIGPRWIGQLIETPVICMINGETARFTAGLKPHDLGAYIAALIERATAYRKATQKPLLEAGFRRAPSFGQAALASTIAMKCGWNGTSNVAALQRGLVTLDQVGGTMAHAFVLSYDTELEAFWTWHDVFPGTTQLTDTHDVNSAIQLLIDNNLKPRDVRIDCSPLDELCVSARAQMDRQGWMDVGIFATGDMTPELLVDFEARDIPFTKTMAGTKYVNPPGFDDQECGFVYKIVEYTRNETKHCPQKTTTGKRNYPGLKSVAFDSVRNEVIVDCNPEKPGYDHASLKLANPDANVVFVNTGEDA